MRPGPGGVLGVVTPGLPWGSAPPSGGDPARQANRHGSGDRVARAMGEAAGHSLSEERPPRTLLWPQSRETWHVVGSGTPAAWGKHGEFPGHTGPAGPRLWTGLDITARSSPLFSGDRTSSTASRVSPSPSRRTTATTSLIPSSTLTARAGSSSWVRRTLGHGTRQTHSDTHRTHAHVNMQSRGLSQVTHAHTHTVS